MMPNSFSLTKSKAYLTNSNATRIIALRSCHFLGRFLILKSIIGGSFFRAMLPPPRRHVSERTSCSQKWARSTEEGWDGDGDGDGERRNCMWEMLGGKIQNFGRELAFCFLLFRKWARNVSLTLLFRQSSRFGFGFGLEVFKLEPKRFRNHFGQTVSTFNLFVDRLGSAWALPNRAQTG